MQYLSVCLHDECDHYWAGPRETTASRKARDHSEETGHYVHHKGRYDSPTNGGVYKDGERADLSRGEKHELLLYGITPTEGDD